MDSLKQQDSDENEGAFLVDRREFLLSSFAIGAAIAKPTAALAAKAAETLEPGPERSVSVVKVKLRVNGVDHELSADSRTTLLDPRNGRIVTKDLADYHVPTQADVPPVEVVMLEEKDSAVNPIGVKGIGEIGITGVAAAIANAAFNATGIRVRSLPLTLDKFSRRLNVGALSRESEGGF